jgi:hypothetical protein
MGLVEVLLPSSAVPCTVERFLTCTDLCGRPGPRLAIRTRRRLFIFRHALLALLLLLRVLILWPASSSEVVCTLFFVASVCWLTQWCDGTARTFVRFASARTLR